MVLEAAMHLCETNSIKDINASIEADLTRLTMLLIFAG
jgi:hypothetical protein